MPEPDDNPGPTLDASGMRYDGPMRERGRATRSVDAPGSFRIVIRRSFRAMAMLIAAFLVASLVAVLVFRFADPPVTMVMLLEPGPVRDIDQRWVGRAAISVSAARTAIAAEDQRFLVHHGMDFDALADALEDYRRSGNLRGASTISQQVAKNVFLWHGRSFVRKGLEAWFALLIDLLWPKERILEVYLNIAEYGPGVFGVEAAAARFFGTSAAALTPRQAATLAAVLPSPKRMRAASPSPYVSKRASEILEQVRLLDQRGHFVGLDW